jgi:hypothetical protein
MVHRKEIGRKLGIYTEKLGNIFWYAVIALPLATSH